MIRLLVDSASDLSAEEGVLVVPLQVEFDGKLYKDGVDIDRDTFYEMLIASSHFPKTSQPSPQDFINYFKEAKEQGDSLLCILLSSGLSGTYQSALLAKNIIDYPNIYLVDSLSASYGIKILVDAARQGIAAGKTIEEIVAQLEELKTRIKIFASVENLNYLCKGGRLSATEAAIGNVAQLKPVITVNQEGQVEVAAKKLGLIKTIAYFEMMLKNNAIDTDHACYLLYSYGQNNMLRLKETLELLELKVDAIKQIGSTIGSHVGPEAFGIIYVVRQA